MNKQEKQRIIVSALFVTILLVFQLGLRVGVSWSGQESSISPGYFEGFKGNFTEIYWNSENRTDTLAYPEQAASYIIFKSGSTYYAKNGSTGQIVSSGTNATTVIQSIVDGHLGLFQFKEGNYTTYGITTDPMQDYEKNAIYFKGAGVRTTIIRHIDGTSPTMNFSCSATGNFGGISDMTLCGAGYDVGTADIVSSEVHPIDIMLENLFVHGGGGHGVRVYSAASGSRIHNLWIEAVSGIGLYIGDGTRLKVSSIHINVCGEKGIYSLAHLDESQFSDITIYGTDGSGWEFKGDGNQISGVYIERSRTSALCIHGQNNTFTNLHFKDWSSGSSSYYGIQIMSTGHHNIISNVILEDSDTGLYHSNLIKIEGNYNLINNVDITFDGQDIEISGIENVLSNIRNLENCIVVDNGNRTIINGRGTNNGDPSIGGQWNGYENYAYRMNVLITDTTNNNLYMAMNNTTYTQIN